MIFEIFKNGVKMGEAEAESATVALSRGRAYFGEGCNSASLKEEQGNTQHPTPNTQHPMSEMDVRELHGDLAPVASAARRKPEVADFKNGRAQAHAASGEGQYRANTPSTTPRLKSGNRESEKRKQTKTHLISGALPRRRHGKFLRKMKKPGARNTCVDKIKYPNSAAAHEEINGMVNRTGKQRRRRLSAYRCSDCGLWHIKSN